MNLNFKSLRFFFIGSDVMELQKLELWFGLITHLLWAVSPVALRMLLFVNLCGHLVLLEFGALLANSVLH